MGQSKATEELLKVARDIIADKLGIIEGARRIDNLRFAVGQPDNQLFMLFRAIASDTDDIPTGEALKFVSPEYLAKAKTETTCYLEGIRNDVLVACEEILKSFSAGAH